MFLEDNLWYSPKNVIIHFKRLEKLGQLKPGTKPFQKAYECFITAVSLVGVMDFTGREGWLQLVDDALQSPDVRTGCYQKITRDNDFTTQDIEVVTYDEFSSDTPIDFLCRTKLSAKKAYDDKTTILCHIHKAIHLPPWTELNKALVAKDFKTKSPVIILGKASPDKEIYSMAQIYPNVDLVNRFDVIDLLKQSKQLGVLRLHRSGQSDIKTDYHPEEKHYPFEKLGIK